MVLDMTKRMFKAHEKRALILSLAVASLLLGLVGCGSGASSDPTEQYKDLNANVKPHNERTEPQALLDRSFKITPDEVTFVEGETNSFYVRVKMEFSSITDYDLVTDVKAFKIERTDEAGKFKITWAVPRGTIPTDESKVEVPYKLEITNAKGTDPRTEKIFREINRTREFSVNVLRSGKAPQIVGGKVTGLPQEVKQGAVAEFSVVVEDPASYEGFAPQINATVDAVEGADAMAKMYVATGAAYVRIDNLAPKFEGQGRWLFKGFFMAAKNDAGVQNGSSDMIETRMTLKVAGRGGAVSKAVEVPVKVKATPATPVVEPKQADVKPAVKPAAKVAATKTKTNTKSASKTVAKK